MGAGGTEPCGPEPYGAEPYGTAPGGTEPSGTEPGGTEPDAPGPDDTGPGDTGPCGPGRDAPGAPGRVHQMVSPGGTIFWLRCGIGPVPAVLSGADSGGGVGRLTPPGGIPPERPPE